MPGRRHRGTEIGPEAGDQGLFGSAISAVRSPERLHLIDVGGILRTVECGRAWWAKLCAMGHRKWRHVWPLRQLGRTEEWRGAPPRARLAAGHVGERCARTVVAAPREDQGCTHLSHRETIVAALIWRRVRKELVHCCVKGRALARIKLGKAFIRRPDHGSIQRRTCRRADGYEIGPIS